MKKILLSILALVTCATITAQQRFAPISKNEYEIWGKHFKEYFKEYTFNQMIVCPSFRPPFALYIGDGSKQDCKRYGNLPAVVSVKDQQGNQHSMEADSISVCKLNSLFKHIVNTATFYSERMGCDGTGYFVLNHNKGVTCWSPIGTCRTTINTLLGIYNAIARNSQAGIDSLMPRVDSLTTFYKKLYPDDYFMLEESDHTVNMPGGKQRHITLEWPFSNYVTDYYFASFEFDFPIPESGYESGKYMPDEYRDKYEGIITNVLRTLFCETALTEQYRYIKITIDNTAPQGYEDKDHGAYNIHESDLTEPRLKELLTHLLQNKR